MSDEFVCTACGKTLSKGWTDQNAVEVARVAGHEAGDGAAMICDDCYESNIEWRRSQ